MKAHLTLTPPFILTGLNFTVKIFDPVSDMLTVNWADLVQSGMGLI